MNLQTSAPTRMNQFVLWLLLTAMMLAAAALFANRASFSVQHSLWVDSRPAAAISDSQPVPRVVAVPVPSQNQPAPSPRVSVTPVPAGAQAQPVAQPVATPPAGY